MKFKLTRSTQQKLLWVAIHVGLVWAFVDAILTGRWWLLALTYAWSLIISTIGHHVGLHRYFCHNSFKTTRWKHVLLAWASVFSATMLGPISYSVAHRHHHRYSDTPKDPHSPKQSGFWYIFFGLWALRSDEGKARLGPYAPARDLMRDPVLQFVETHYFHIWYIATIVLYLIGGIDAVIYFLYAPAGAWITLGNAVNNCGGHYAYLPGSYRNFDLDDHSVNNPIINLLTPGEGYQNNHHKYPNSPNTAVTEKEWDFVYWVIKTFFEVKTNDTKTS